jgi:DNA-binding Lrp family transcriptional regulator
MCPESSVPQKILNYVRSKQVISISEVSQEFGLSPITAKNYLSRLAQTGEIKSIGRGIYQVGKAEGVTIRPAAALAKLAKELRDAFPMAEFTVWSLQMLSEYSHYMIGKDLMFIETSKMLSASMRDMLVPKGYRVVLQPEKRDFQEFAYYPQVPIFILERKELYGLLEFESYLIPTPERIWADIYYFCTRKSFVFDPFELGLIFVAMVDKGGINFDRLLRYSARRGIFREILIFLYELMKTNSKVGKNIAEHVLLGRRETLSTIATMVEGARRND